MRNLPAWIVGVSIVAIAVVKWPAYDKPNALQGALHQLGLAVLLGVWAWRARGRSDPERPDAPGAPRQPWPGALLAVYALLAASSPLWARHPRLGAIEGVTIAANVLWALVVCALVRRTDSLRVAAGLMALVPLALGVAAVWDKVHYPVLWISQRHGHPNMLASVLLLPLFAAAGVLGARPRRSAALGLILAVGAGLFLLSQARAMGAWVGLAAGSVLFAAALLKARWRRLLFVALGVAVALAVLTAGVALRPGGALRRRVLRTQQATRLLHLEGAAAMLARRPVMGWGAGNFMSEFSDFKPTEGLILGWGGNVTLHPHNELALIAVETGGVGLALYVMAAVLAVLRAAAAAERTRDGTRRWMIAACLGGFVATFVHGLFTVALRYWGPMALHWTSLGLLLAAGGPPELRRLSRHTRQAGAIAAAAAAALLLALVTAPGQCAHYLMGRAEDVAAGPRSLDRALGLYRRVRPLSRYVPQYVDAHLNPARLLQAAGQRDRAIAAYERVEALAPGLGPTRFWLGCLYLHRFERGGGRAADAHRAAAVFGKYVGQRPDLARARAHYARALLALSPPELSRAAEQLRAAAAVAPRSADVHALLGECLLRMRQYTEAEPTLARTVALRRQEHARVLGRVLTSMAFRAPLSPETWRQVRARRRDLAGACLLWARVAAGRGRVEEARARLRLALGCAPDWPELRQDAQRLEQTMQPRR